MGGKAEHKLYLISRLVIDKCSPDLRDKYNPISAAIEERIKHPVVQKKSAIQYSDTEIEEMLEPKLREVLEELISMGEITERWRTKSVFLLPKRIKKAIASLKAAKTQRRRLADRFIRESIRCQNS